MHHLLLDPPLPPVARLVSQQMGSAQPLSTIRLSLLLSDITMPYWKGEDQLVKSRMT